MISVSALIIVIAVFMVILCLTYVLAIFLSSSLSRPYLDFLKKIDERLIFLLDGILEAKFCRTGRKVFNSLMTEAVIT